MEILMGFRRCECGEWYRIAREEDLTQKCERCEEKFRKVLFTAEQYPGGDGSRSAHFLDDD